MILIVHCILSNKNEIVELTKEKKQLEKQFANIKSEHEKGLIHQSKKKIKLNEATIVKGTIKTNKPTFIERE